MINRKHSVKYTLFMGISMLLITAGFCITGCAPEKDTSNPKETNENIVEINENTNKVLNTADDDTDDTEHVILDMEGNPINEEDLKPTIRLDDYEQPEGYALQQALELPSYDTEEFSWNIETNPANTEIFSIIASITTDDGEEDIVATDNYIFQGEEPGTAHIIFTLIPDIKDASFNKVEADVDVIDGDYIKLSNINYYDPSGQIMYSAKTVE